MPPPSLFGPGVDSTLIYPASINPVRANAADCSEVLREAFNGIYFVRRSLGVEECRHLLALTEDNGYSYHMSGRERALLYRVALETGRRANEIKTVSRQQE